MIISRRTALRCVSLVFLIVGYTTGYLCMLTPEKWTYCISTTDGSSLHTLAPKFKIEHPAVHAFYAPLLWLDRTVRPTYWSWAEKPEHPLGYYTRPHQGGGIGGSMGPPIRYIEVDPKTGKPLKYRWDRGKTE